ncbi:MAG TPA: hypothetical protein VFH63_00985 [candidate division Zixibacteria bacterium]|nr:hypothetical protein [candidate division Zixibacteria bacterium]
MTRDVRLGVLAVAALGALVFAFLVIGSLGPPRAEIVFIPVADVLDGPPPAERFGRREVRIAGWWAELDADCREHGPAAVGWLERTCPLRVLMPYQPELDVTQAELEANGLRLSAPNGRPFPSRAQPGGPNLRPQQLVFVGHFDDPAAGECTPERRERCRNTFVVSDYDGLLR